jgi:hypothetical protein
LAKRPQEFRARFALPPRDEEDSPIDDIAIEREPGEPMTEDELAALLDGQIEDAKNYESSDLTQLREKALKFFEGEVDIPSAPGRSSVVSRDMADVHGMILPGLMRVFLATDNIAIYNPETQADEKFAGQATDYVNMVVMRECSGYRQLRSSMHDGLALGNGILKHWWDETPEYTTESFSGLSEDAYTMLADDPDVEEIIEHTEYDDPAWVPPPPEMPLPGMDMGMPAAPTPAMLPAPKLHDCKLKRCMSRGRLRLMVVPPEDLLLGRGTTVLDEENVRFVAHRWIKTRSALIKEGFDPDEVDALPAYTSAKLDTPEALARDRHHLYEGDIAPDKSTELIEGYECYVQCDYYGDGVASWFKVNKGAVLGDSRGLLSVEEWGDDLPFSDIVPDPIPHRWRGRSLFDATEDVQRVKTVLMRQTLDNVYLNNVPLQAMQENQVVNPEALVDREIGALVITRGDPNTAISTIATPFTADRTFPIVEYMDSVLEKRTGISRASMALDPDTLQDQTATAVNAAQAAAFTKVEEYARNIAEHGGLERVFSKILKLIVKHQDRARTVRLRGEWVEVDPRAWNANMSVTINTGLGSGSRDRDLAMLTQIAQKQEQIVLQLGPVNPVVGIDKLMETYRLLVEATGLKSPERFFPEVAPETLQQMQEAASNPPPDPKVQVAQMQAQFDAQKQQQQAQFDAQKMQKQAELDAMKLQAETQMAQEEARFKQQMEQARAEREAQLALARAQHDAELQQVQLQRQAEVEERQAQTAIAVEQTEAENKMRLAEMEAVFAQQLAREKFEFDKKLKLLDLWAKSRIEASKRAAEQSGEPDEGETGQAEFEGMLKDEGADIPTGMAKAATPLEAAMKHMADTVAGSHAQLTQMVAALGQHMSTGHAENARMLAGAVAESSKPKRQRVLRDEKNRVVGVETVQ